MRNILTGSAVFVLAAQIFILMAGSPATAITADLAKKCREMAIKAHPPPNSPGNKAYAQAERDFFRECVSKNGQMKDNSPPKAPPPKSE